MTMYMTVIIVGSHDRRPSAAPTEIHATRRSSGDRALAGRGGSGPADRPAAAVTWPGRVLTLRPRFGLRGCLLLGPHLGLGGHLGPGGDRGQQVV
jgi:hypothetical protein